MTFCTGCGTEIKDGAKFCSACGAPVATMTPTASTATTEEPKKNVLSLGLSLGIIAGTVVISIGLSVAAYFIISKSMANTPEPEEYSETVEYDDENDSEEIGQIAEEKSEERTEVLQKEPAPTSAKVTVTELSIAEKNDILADKYKEIQSALNSFEYMKIQYNNELRQEDFPEGYIGVYTMKRDMTSNILYAFKISDQKLLAEVWDVDENGNAVSYTDGPFLSLGEDAANSFGIHFYFGEGRLIMEKSESWNLAADGGTTAIYVAEYENGHINKLVDQSLFDLDAYPEETYYKAADELRAIGLESDADHVLNDQTLSFYGTYWFNPLFCLRCNSFCDLQGTYYAAFEQYKDTNAYYIFEKANTQYLSDADIEKVEPKIQLWLGRNEIYARHNRKFKDEKLSAYFESMDWYWGEYDEVNESEFNDYEKANIELIKKYEDKYKEEIENEKKQFYFE